MVSMSISVTGSFPMTRQVSVFLPVTLRVPFRVSAPVFPRNVWTSFCPLGYIPAKDSHDDTAKVIYKSQDRKSRKVFNALDWLARLHLMHMTVRVCF